jgi:uncharacterized protein (DUF1684 family)
MRRRARLLFPTLSVVVAITAAACARDVAPTPISDAAYQTAYAKHLATRSASLVTAGKPKSFTGLRWLKPGVTTIGSDSTNNVVLVGRDVPAKVGTLTRDGFKVRFDIAPGVTTLVDSTPGVSRELATDAAGTATRVDVGTAGFRIVKRVDSIGVRMWDADRATMTGIEPLAYFKRDMKWRLGGKFTRRAKPDTIAVPTASGVAEEHIDVGTIAINVEGTPYQLTAFAGTGPTDLFITFSDASSGEETYGFRFVHAPLDTVTNIAVVDFNFAYNPDCAFSAYTTCPLPPASNRLAPKILAGEKIVVHTTAAKP